MVLILLALIVLGVVGTVLLIISTELDGGFLVFLVGFVASAAAAVGLCSYAFLGYQWIASGHQTDIINREYGTTYTQQEVFYASEVIDVIRQLDRKRIELNGDLITGE